jgi:glyoxylase-like metal-dependent hydrolase (beta-lactamase superfamily II)
LKSFKVLHLPGVTNGASGLYERESGLVFTGEAFVWVDDFIYEREPLDRSNSADLEAFKNSI